MINKEKTTGLITIIITLLVMLAIMTFTLGSGESYGNRWFVQPERSAETGAYLGESVIIGKEGTAEKIYVHIGNVYNADEDGNLVFDFDASSSAKRLEQYGIFVSLSRFSLTLKPTDGKVFTPGWYLLGEKLSVSDSYVRITTKQSFDFDEIVFLDKDGKLLSVECYGGFDSKKKFVSATDEACLAAAVTDGQKSFALDSMHILSKKEESLAATARNLYSYSGYYLSDNVTPFGAVLNGLGMPIFGQTPFGVRFVPFLFSVATLILIYFFAKKVIGGSFYGVLAVATWFVAGLGLSIGGVATITASACFFILAAAYFAYSFYTENSSAAFFSHYKSLVLSCVFAGLAGAVDPIAFGSFIGIAFVAISSVVKRLVPMRNAYATESGLEKEYAREKYVKATVCAVVALVLSLVVLPILLLIIPYGFFFGIYGEHYSAGGVFAAAFANFGAMTATDGSSVLGWLCGLGSENARGLSARVITSNKALVALSFVLTVLYLVLHFVNRAGKIRNEKLAFALNENRRLCFIAFAFIVVYLGTLVGGTNQDYSRFAYSLIFLVLAVPCAYKLYNGNVGSLAFGLSLTVVSVVVFVFFALSVVCFLGIPIPASVAKYLYAWML